MTVHLGNARSKLRAIFRFAADVRLVMIPTRRNSAASVLVQRPRLPTDMLLKVEERPASRVQTLATLVLCSLVPSCWPYCTFLVWDNLDGAKDMIPIEDENSEDAAATTHNTNMPFHSIVIRIVSSYLQVAGMLLQFDLHLPPSVRTLISVEGSTGSLRYVVCSFIFLIVSRFC